jgi:hypothetical protein
MKLFDKQGMMLFPLPEQQREIGKSKSLLVVSQCFCQKGHDMVSEKAIFDGFNGILLKVKKSKQSGLVALSPVYGMKNRISLNIKLTKNELLELLCPTCNTALSIFSPCSCGGNLVALFLDKKADFTNCILICNRVDCFNAAIKLQDEMIHYDGVDKMIFG